MKLTKKQHLFVKHYLIHLNASKAARAAGYSKKTAHRMGQENMQKPIIRDEIERAMSQRSKKLEITADMVLAELAKIGFADMREFAAWDRMSVNLKDSSKLTKDQSAAVSEVSLTQSGLKIKLHDKKGSLDLIGQHLGMWKKNINLSNPDGTLKGVAQVVITLPSNGREKQPEEPTKDGKAKKKRS